MRKTPYTLMMVLIVMYSTTAVGTTYQIKREETKQEDTERRILNLPDNPLQIRLSQNHNYIHVENHSDKTVRQYRLGCVIKEAEKIKCLRSVTERSIELEPIDRKNDRITADSFGIERSGIQHCKEEVGRLTVIEVTFDDDSVWKLGAEQ